VLVRRLGLDLGLGLNNGFRGLWLASHVTDVTIPLDTIHSRTFASYVARLVW
jgi:hypothetical protein